MTTSHKHNFNELAKLVGLQLLGFIVFEAIVWLMVMANVLPTELVINGVAKINTMYFVVIALIMIIVSAVWLAILTEFGIVKIEKV